MMYTIFSDIQGNYSALEKFFEEIKHIQHDECICLGDIVGNGTSFEENRCASLIKENRCIAIKGNHEEDVLRRIDTDRTVRKRFWSENVDYLRKLETEEKKGDIVLVHKSPSGKKIENVDDGEREFKTLGSDIKICFFGHSHRYIIYEEIKEGEIIDRSNEGVITLSKDKRYLINPGGIGLYYGLPLSYITFEIDTLKIVKRELKR